MLFFLSFPSTSLIRSHTCLVVQECGIQKLRGVLQQPWAELAWGENGLLCMVNRVLGHWLLWCWYAHNLLCEDSRCPGGQVSPSPRERHLLHSVAHPWDQACSILRGDSPQWPAGFKRRVQNAKMMPKMFTTQTLKKEKKKKWPHFYIKSGGLKITEMFLHLFAAKCSISVSAYMASAIVTK